VWGKLKGRSCAWKHVGDFLDLKLLARAVFRHLALDSVLAISGYWKMCRSC